MEMRMESKSGPDLRWFGLVQGSPIWAAYLHLKTDSKENGTAWHGVEYI